MGWFWVIVLSVIGFLVWHAIVNAVVKAPGNTLQNKFAKLTEDTNGVIAGKTYTEIVAVCGYPNAASAIGNGSTLRQWIATSYHIALVFDENDVCTGISSEVSV